MHEIFFDPARSLRNCGGSRVFLWGARAASLRVSAASRNRLSTFACSGRIHNTSPVEDSPSSDFWRLAKTDFRIGEHTACPPCAGASRVTPSPARTSVPSPNALCPIELGLCACRANEFFFEYSLAIALSRESSLPRKQPPNVDYANFGGKFALTANRGQLTG
jgi:hypothetical protein